VRRHDLDVTSLVSGLLFLGIAAIWLLGAGRALNVGHGWVLPALFVGVGAVGLGTAVRRNRQ
jgi:hypothetical protein